MKRQTKLNQQEQQQTQAAEQQTQKSVKEFATPEEMLRYDAAHTPVPAGIAQRLQQSVETLPKPARPWWRRLWNK